MQIDLVTAGQYEMYNVGYFTDQDQDCRYQSYSLAQVISFVHDNYKINGVYVVKDSTVAGQVLDRMHIIEFIEQNYEKIIKQMIRKELDA